MNIVYKICLLAFLLAYSSTNSFAQTDCNFTPDAVIDCDTVSVNPSFQIMLADNADCFNPLNDNNGRIDFDIFGFDFTALSQIELTIRFNAEAYSYISAPAGGAIDDLVDNSEADSGVIRYRWMSDDGNGLCLADGTLLSRLRFVSDVGTCIPIELTIDVENSFAIVKYNEDGEECTRDVNLDSKPYGLCITNCVGDTVSNSIDIKPTLNFSGPETINEVDQVCYDVTMSDFVSVISVQFAINYDPRVLEYASVTSGLLNAIEGNNFNIATAENGVLSFVWIDLTNLGVCADEDEVLITVCFDPIGKQGENTLLSFNNWELSDIEVGYGFSSINQPPCTADVCATFLDIDIACSELFYCWSACSESAPGADDATAIIRPCGGTPPYTLCVAGPTPDITGIQEGEEVFLDNLTGGASITAILKDSGGSPVFTDDITPGIAPPIMAEFEIIEPSCSNSSNGAINITNITGGLPFPNGDYEIGWSNGIFNDDTNTSLENGVFAVTIADSEGCEIVQDFTLDREPLTVTTSVIDNPTCLMIGAPGDGIVQIDVSGGTPPYQFNCNSATFDNSTMIDNVQPGMFDFVICDANNCQIRDTIEIEADVEFNFIEKDFCNDCGEGGAISLGIQIPGIDQDDVNVTANFFSQTTGDAFPLGNLGGDCLISQSPLPPDSYTIIVTNDGCSDRFEFTVSEFDPLTISTEVTQPGCDGNSGQIEVLDVSGAINTIEYIWSIPGEDGPVVSNLSEGTYRLTVTDGRCKREETFMINAGGDAELTATCTPASCDGGGTNGSLSAVLSGSLASDLTCVWTDDAGNTVGTGNDIIGVGAGMYFVVCSDNSGSCMVTDSCMIENADAVVLDLNTAIDPDCSNLEGGVIWVNAPTTNTPVTFQWEGPDGFTSSDSSMVSGLVCGTYNLTVTDATGCPSTFSHTLDCPPEVTVEITQIEPVICDGPDTGRALAMASGGTTTSGNYTFLFSSGSTNLGSLGTGIDFTEGEQWVIACDDECCTDTLFFEVPGVQIFSLDETLTVINNTSCFGEADGGVTLVATGGNEPYEYIWSIDNFNGDTRDDLPAGEYEITIIDSDGCENIDFVTIAEPQMLLVEIDPNNTNDVGCNTVGTGRIGLDITGGTAPFTFQWTDDVSTTDQATDLEEGEFCVTITDVNLCMDVVCHTIEAAEALTAVVNEPGLPTCFGGTTCISIQQGSVMGGIGNSFSWSVNSGLNMPLDSCLEVTAGEYTIRVFDNQSGAECPYEEVIIVDQPDPVLVDLGEDPPAVELGDSLTTLTAQITNALPVINISWNQPVECVDPNFCNEVLISPLNPTFYSVTVTDENGCIGVDDVFVDVSDSRNVFFSNILSINSQIGNNEFNLVTGQGVSDIETLIIYDRYGNLMFETSGLNADGTSEAWDGRFDGQFVNPGVYVYYARVSFVDDRVIEYSGNITVVR